MDAGKQRFEEAWPELASRLKASLRRRNVSPWLTDDIVQETGLRLFKRWDSVDPELSPWGLTLTIAKNLLWDARNRHHSREILVDPPERPVSHDVENAGIARLELRRVARALGRMSHNYQAVLLAEVGGAEATGPSTAATKMLRMRARKRLNTLLESASASCLAAIGAARRWAFDAQQFVRRAIPVIESSTSVTVAALVGAVVVIVPATGSTSPDVGDALSRSSSERTFAVAAADQRPGSSADAAPAHAGSARRAPQPDGSAPDEATRHEVELGEDVGGSAGVERRRRKSDEVLKPDCNVEPRDEEIYFKCTVDTRDERYKIEGGVRVKLDPDGN